MQLLAVNFHYVREPPPHPGIHPISPLAFERQVSELGREFEFVSLTQLSQALDGGSLPERSCLITFDDGLREQFEVAWPILQRMGVPAAFFVNTSNLTEGTVSAVHKLHHLRAHTPPNEVMERTRAACVAAGVRFDQLPPSDADMLARQYRYDDPPTRELKYLLNFQLDPPTAAAVIDRLFDETFDSPREFAHQLYMDREQWIELASADSLATHGHRHNALAQFSAAEVERSLRQSGDIIEAATGHRPEAVSYPFGGPTAVSRSVAEAAGRAGLRLGFTMERAVNRSLDDPLLLARADTNDIPGGKRPQFLFIEGELKYQPGFAPARNRYFQERT